MAVEGGEKVEIEHGASLLNVGVVNNVSGLQPNRIAVIHSVKIVRTIFGAVRGELVEP